MTDAAHSGMLEPHAWGGMSFQERMATTEFRIHHLAHIVVDGSVCADCSTRDCVVACPANLFVPTADGGIVFNHEQCFECGACYMVCTARERSAGTTPRAATASSSAGPER